MRNGQDNRDWCPLCERTFNGKTEGESFTALKTHMSNDHKRLVDDVDINAAEMARQRRYKALEMEELTMLMAPIPSTVVTVDMQAAEQRILAAVA